MKKIILSLSLFLSLSLLAGTLEERRKEWNQCALNAVTESEKKFEGKMPDESRDIVIAELCEFVKRQDDMDGCKIKLHELEINGRLHFLIQTMVLGKYVFPACGEAPSEN